MKWLKKHYHRYMLRPILYRTFACVLGGVVLALAWQRFVDQTRGLSAPFFALAVVFGAMAWFNYLAIDGVGSPMTHKRPSLPKEQRATGDVADYLDEEIVSFKDLGKSERQWCRLAVNLICLLLFLAASLF